MPNEKEERKQCSETIFRDYVNYKCTKPVVITVEGKHFCKIHSPEYIAKQQEKRQAIYNSTKCKNEKCHFNFRYTTYYSFCPFCGLKKS